MRRKKIIEAAVVCILLLLLGAYMEFSDRSMDDKTELSGAVRAVGGRKWNLR